MNKVNILCLYWVGQFRGRDFKPTDVDRLYRSVKKHIDRPFDFYVLSNVDKVLDFNVIPLKYNWPGWWSKMELHRPDLPEGRTLYMDLDSHAIRSLAPILDYPGNLVMFDTRIPKRKWKRLIEQKWVPRYQAATMLFTPGCPEMKGIWDKFESDPEFWMKKYRSDQDVMGAWIPNQPTFPETWMAKLGTYRNGGMPHEDCIIITGQDKTNLFREHENRVPWLEKMAR